MYFVSALKNGQNDENQSNKESVNQIAKHFALHNQYHFPYQFKNDIETETHLLYSVKTTYLFISVYFTVVGSKFTFIQSAW